MAGVSGRSGRPKALGKRYYLGYFRLLPADPPELHNLLDAINQATGRQRRDMLRAALLGGANKISSAVKQGEARESADLLEEMFDDF